MTVSRQLGLFLAAGFLSFACSRWAYPRQTKSAGPQTNELPGLILPRPQPNAAGDSTPGKIEQLSDLASRLLQYIGNAGCKKGDCKILVSNFNLNSGYASPYGIQAADELALELAHQDKTIQVIDRNLFKVQLQQQENEQIPISILSSDSVARWLGLKLGANIVLVGTARGIVNSNAVELSGRFLNSRHERKRGPSAEVNSTPPVPPPDLSPIGLPQLPPLPEALEGEQVYQAGKNGVGLPSCYYTPYPDFTNDARDFHFSGIGVVEGIVRPDGTVRAFRFVRGIPYGMNRAILDSLNSWKCKPARLAGKPVAVFVPLEFTFRLY